MKKRIFTLICLGFLSGGPVWTASAQGKNEILHDFVGQGWPSATNPNFAVVEDRTAPDAIYSGCQDTLQLTGAAVDQIWSVRVIPFVKTNPADKDSLHQYTTLPGSIKITQAHLDAAKDAGFVIGSAKVILPFSTGEIPTKYNSIMLIVRKDSDTPDTISYDFYNYPKVTIDYTAPAPVKYTGKADIRIAGGSKKILRSLNGGYTWQKVYKDDGTIEPLTETEISNIGTVLFKEPNSCGYITVQVRGSGGGGGQTMPALSRVVTIPAVSGVTMSPATGTHRVANGSDFTFTVKVSDATLEPKIETGRTDRPEGYDVVQTYLGDGVYEVTVKIVNSALRLSISLAPAGITDAEGTHVWGAGGQIHLTAATAASATIYSATGAQVKTVALGAGETTGVSLPAGFYIVALNGKAYKVVLK
jgi:hypothetical protein